ncbi:hypothetical protein PUMCH_000384 [Australozyma saopauloensis]|uniref:Dipeptidyl aminopeptidase B n=1 Tax=Australozyma saopauloensis TaxID=291208 RepID=A0AAX4H5B9_9ASCO|nr:hypothetical protein PUMCH_000384 [[Candida] saopauloensis]
MTSIDIERWTHNDKKTISRSFLYGLTLLVGLIWGSVLLVSSVNTLVSLKDELVITTAVNHINDDYSWQKSSSKHQLTLETWRKGTFRPTFQLIQWIQSPESVHNDQGTYLVKETSDSDKNAYVVKSILDDKYTHTLFSGSSFKYHGVEYKVHDLQASPDLTRAVIRTDWVHGWRHSSSALFWILDVESQQIVPLFNTNDKISFASWSPTSDHIAFVYDNNIFVKDLASGTISQLTFDGSADVFNGKPDWVYEEEVYASDRVLWWSPEGDKFTFLKFNDASVPDFPIPYYVQDGHDEYPEMVSLKYPKPGYSNPIVELVVAQLPKSSGSAFKMYNVDFSSSEIKERLITEVLWVSNTQVLAKITNRASDVQEVYLIPSEQDQQVSIVRSLKASSGWFEVNANAMFVPKNASLGRYADGYIDLVEKDGFNHLAYFLPPESSNPIFLTGGQWEVLSNYVDLQNNIVYFTATISASVERHFYSIDLLHIFHEQGLPKINPITNGTKWYGGSFSSGSRFLLLNDLGPDVPLQRLVDLHENRVVKTLETNEHIAKLMTEYDLPKANVSVIDLIPDGNKGKSIKVNTVEILPPNFDPSKRYPVLFYVYGGPGSQLVTQTFAIDFSHVIAAHLNSVVVTVDGRGTGFNNLNLDLGSQFKFCVRDKLGHFEPLDQIAAAKEWASRTYVDETRIAIWGWSYGGFLTLKTLEKDKDRVFSYGVSVAPVTQWKLYDSIYTERYMRTPQENPEGYVTASISDPESFKDVTRFLIMHGSGDDNVHFQNSLRLLDEFNLHSVENFDFMVFPDSDHSISYHNGNKVVYDRIVDWLRRAFANDFTRSNSPSLN